MNVEKFTTKDVVIAAKQFAQQNGKHRAYQVFKDIESKGQITYGQMIAATKALYGRNAHRYQVITYSHDSGLDEKMEYNSITEARRAIKTEYSDGHWCGWAIWDHRDKRVIDKIGAFPY